LSRATKVFDFDDDYGKVSGPFERGARKFHGHTFEGSMDKVTKVRENSKGVLTAKIGKGPKKNFPPQHKKGIGVRTQSGYLDRVDPD
jgi:hypothetical protein